MKKFNKWLDFERTQWRLRKIERNERSTMRIMRKIDLEFDDVNLRVVLKEQAKGMEKWLMKNLIN